MQYSLIIGFLLLHLYVFYRHLNARSSAGRKRLTWGVTVSTVLLYLLTYLRVQQRFGEGFGKSDVLTNWLMGLSLTTFLCFSIMGAIFLIGELIELLPYVRRRMSGNAASEGASLSRRRFVSRFSLALASLPFAASVYGMWRGKYAFAVKEVSLSFKDLPAAFDGFKIVQFSDFHSGSFDDLKAVDRGLKLLNAQGADAIVFTGDWVNEFAGELEEYVPLLAQLEAPFGKFGVLGNHDFGGGRINDIASERSEEATKAAEASNLSKLKAKIAHTGFTLLNNAHQRFEIEGQYINLIGVENWGHAPFPQLGDLDKATAGCTDGFNVLLSHDPTHWEEKVLPHERHFHLTMSGHTHGSQVGIERAWLRWAPVQYVYERWAGLYTEQSQHLYVNRGFGFIGYAGRVGIPPEVTSFTLRKA